MKKYFPIIFAMFCTIYATGLFANNLIDCSENLTTSWTIIDYIRKFALEAGVGLILSIVAIIIFSGVPYIINKLKKDNNKEKTYLIYGIITSLIVIVLSDNILFLEFIIPQSIIITLISLLIYIYTNKYKTNLLTNIFIFIKILILELLIVESYKFYSGSIYNILNIIGNIIKGSELNIDKLNETNRCIGQILFIIIYGLYDIKLTNKFLSVHNNTNKKGCLILSMYLWVVMLYIIINIDSSMIKIIFAYTFCNIWLSEKLYIYGTSNN